jgi:hypothetical protein
MSETEISEEAPDQIVYGFLDPTANIFYAF